MQLYICVHVVHVHVKLHAYLLSSVDAVFRDNSSSVSVRSTTSGPVMSVFFILSTFFDNNNTDNIM